VQLPPEHPRAEQYARTHSGQISLEEIIRGERESDRQQQGEELQDIIKEVLIEAENLRR
jgi:hypothetical protein